MATPTAWSALRAVVYREARIRVTNAAFIFWDVFYPLAYMLVFGVGMDAALGAPTTAPGVDYNAFFLGGVLGMASFGIASNTAWSFFMDRDNGIFYEMLTYPLSRSQYLLGKVLFNVLIGVLQSAITELVAEPLMGRPPNPIGRGTGSASTPVATASSCTVTCPPAGVNLTALPSRLTNTCSSRCGSADT